MSGKYTKLNKHGGSRKGSGRKKLPEDKKKKSKVMRIPLQHVEAVKNLLYYLKANDYL